MTAPLEVVRNPAARPTLPGPPPDRAPLAFHATLAGYAPTPLLEAPALAAELGLRRLWLKDETARLGLPAFKIMGASWAVARALADALDVPLAPDAGLAGLRNALAALRQPLTLITATDGNHGRAVARMARLLGLPARIHVPDDMVEARREAIRSEGAQVVEEPGGYDAAVAASARAAGPGDVIVSDTSWPGYEAIPSAVIEGYSTLLHEVDDALRARGEPDPDLVVVPVGVGALAAAVARHYRRPGLERRPILVSVEPTSADCVLQSIRAGRPVTLPGPQHSIMAGLNCGTPSRVAWPTLQQSFDLFVAIDDDLAREGMRRLDAAGVVGGECAGGAVGALGALLSSPARDALDPASSALVLLTEGATDPAAYEAIVGHPPGRADGAG
jgi:diaminopropionate ammonia-lyase